jgi:formate C-acetyltransferase
MGTASQDGWRGFQGERWREKIDVGRFIHDNLRPYEGGAEFLAGPTARTQRIWRELQRMFVEERRRGIYDVDAHTPSTISCACASESAPAAMSRAK